jgi:hypothetical protein
MNCQEISDIIDGLKVNSLGRIRGKSQVIDKMHSAHLTDLDNALMDVRVFVARLSTGYSSTEILKMIDEFIYKIQAK